MCKGVSRFTRLVDYAKKDKDGLVFLVDPFVNLYT